MRHNKRQRSIATWAACFAVLLAALAPSLSHFIAASSLTSVARQSPAPASISMLPHGASQSDAHVMREMVAAVSGDASTQCSMQGAEIQSGSLSHETGSHAPALHFEHCPFCFTHAGSFSLPASETLSPLATAAYVARMPLRFYQCASPIFVWDAAQPRAPPFLS